MYHPLAWGDIPTYMDIVAKVLAQIDLLLQNFVFNGYNALSRYLQYPLAIVTSIYIALFGYALIGGWVQLRLPEVLSRIVRIGLIYMAVLNWGWVSYHLVDFVNAAIGEIGDALIQASPVQIPGALGLTGALQIVLIQFTKLGSAVFDTGGITNLGGWLDGVVLWGFGYLMVGIGVFEIVLAKVMLAILFIFTPLMVIFCYFKPLHALFDRWLGAVVGFALLQLFVTAALTLALSLDYWWVAAYVATSALNIGNFGTLPAIILGTICIGLVLKAAHLAQNLGGMVSVSSGAGALAGIVGGFVGSGLNTATHLVSSALALPKALVPKNSHPSQRATHQNMDAVHSRTKK